MMKRFISKYGGVILGAIYGLLLRFIFNFNDISESIFGFNLFSVSFIWVAPVIIGIIPLIFATNKQLENPAYSILSPVLTVLIFFTFALLTRIEDLVCIIVITFPFMLGAMIGGFVFSKMLKNIKRKKGIIYSIILVPFLSAIIENKFDTPINIYSAESTVVISSTEDVIWQNIVRVKKIDEKEYNKGFLNYAGIPRPLFAELDKDTVGAKRIGHFEGGLTFEEKVTSWKRNQEVAFDITVVPSSIRETVFDQHILKGRHFKFINATYKLNKINNNKIILTLSSSYELQTNINSYSSFWGHYLLTDFQDRLLSVIKQRAERQ
ncbi:MAG: hypothetical protein QM802_20185 [Agriterribacter sp.]